MPTPKDSKIDEAVDELRHRINEGIYVAGQRLPAEREIAEEMNVSRQTVHSALARLQTDGVIDIVPRGGAFVRSPSAKIVIGPPGPNVLAGPELKRAGSFI